MTSKSPFLIAATCALPLSIAACGGGSDGPIIPEGPHHGYVVSSVSVPTTDKQVTDFGLDLGSKTSSKQDGKIDDQLGSVLSLLSSLKLFDIQGTVNTAVDQGSLLLLVDVQTKDFMNSNGAGFGVKIGANPMPAPCNGSADTVCRHHLDGTGTFTIAANSPSDLAVAGKIASGTFNGGPGDVTLQLAIGSTTPIELSLLHARVKATSISEAGIMTATVGGLVTQAELTTSIGPAIQTQVNGILDRDCPVAAGGTRTPPSCGCNAGTTGETVIKALDGTTPGTVADCQITTEEILGFPLVAQLLKPDSCSTDTCKTPDSLSVGVQIEAVKATFSM
jgi:hypothetical protein